MATPGGIAAGLLGSAASEAAAFAAGLAIGPTLAPEIEFLRNEAWSAVQTKTLDPATAAEVAAENFASFAEMRQQAAYNGIAAPLFQYLYDVTLTAPGMGELLNMLRRGTINSGNFAHGLRKAKFEPMWDGPLAELASQKLSVADIAYMVVRGILPDDGMLGVTLPTQADNLRLPPQLPLDPVAEAALTGWDRERLRAFVGRSGLAMAPVMAAQARFRGILTQNDYELTIARGDLYPAFAGPVLEASRQILTAGEYVEGSLRGWTSDAEMYAGTAKHGMTQADTDLLFKITGRPIATHQITTGLARGGTYPSTYADVPEPYRKAIQESNIRPEWASLDYHNRYTYPSAFVLRSLAQSGEIGGEAAVEQVLLEIGWKPSFATTVAKAWTAGNAAGDPHVGKAQTQLWGTTHRSYVAEEIDNATATTAIEAAGVPAATAPAVLALWGHERALVRKQLSPAQIKKAVHEAVTNPATGQPWTQADALAALMARGYDQADATTLLEL